MWQDNNLFFGFQCKCFVPKHFHIITGMQIGHNVLRLVLPVAPLDILQLHVYPNETVLKSCTHPPMGGGVCTNHKSSNIIEICQLGQDLFNY